MNLFSLGFGSLGNAPGAADYYMQMPYSVGGGIAIPSDAPGGGFIKPIGPVYGPAIPSIVEVPPPFSPSDQLSVIPYVMPTYLPSATAPTQVITVDTGVVSGLKGEWGKLSPNVKLAIGVSAAAAIGLLALSLIGRRD